MSTKALPDKAAFMELSSRGNLIPVYKEIFSDLDTPVSAFMKLGDRPSFLLESVEGGEKWARYSFLGLAPSVVIKGTGRDIVIDDCKNGLRTLKSDDPIDFIKQVMAQYKSVTVEGLPRFYGGLVGYMGYDMVRFMEDLPDKNPAGYDMPDMFLMLTDTMLVFDNLKQTIKVIANAHLDGQGAESAYNAAIAKIDAIIERLKQPLTGAYPNRNDKGNAPSGGFVSGFGPRENFESAVDKAKEYILAGDIVQAVLSQRFERKTTASAFDIYRCLRVINPSPYMYYLNIGETEIVGSSPEILVRLEGDKITLRPIAGTRRRGSNEDEDRNLEVELKNDPKEIAEHIMLVDLGRNDVGRVAEVGSVKVTDLMSVERYSHVMHIVSNVEGRLKRGLDEFDVLRACFPAGTVSGAPKVRAMQIIDELEPIKRGPYAGAVGYFSYGGNMDTCITIRTLIIKDKTVYVQAGAGIVADSVPSAEYAETVNKAAAMMKAVEMAEDMAR